MAEVRLKAREAAYLRAFAMIALEMQLFRETIDDEADQVIGNALGCIGQQLARMQYEDGPTVESLMPQLFQPWAYPDLGLDLEPVLLASLRPRH